MGPRRYELYNIIVKHPLPVYRRRSLNHEGIDRDARPRSGIIAIRSICIRFVAEVARCATRAFPRLTHFNNDNASDCVPFYTRSSYIDISENHAPLKKKRRR